MKSPSEPPHIAVVGAGLAGLRCADMLLQYGFKVTILEGRNRLGGRVCQTMLSNGFLVDMGPNWIHGTTDNPIYHISKESGTMISSWDHNPYIIGHDGKLLELEEATELSNKFWEVVQLAFSHSEKHCITTDVQESLYNFFLRKIHLIFPDNGNQADQERVSRKRTALLQMAQMWGAYVGSPVENQSLKYFWLEECLEGENLLCAGTYSNILDVISKPAIEGADIIFNTTVARIQTRKSSTEKVRLIIKSGSTLEFDEVVVTAPLGWLKKNLGAFEPELPVPLRKAIQSIGYGCLEKVYITFPAAFWKRPMSDGRKIHGFGQFVSPEYSSSTNPNRWNQEMVELASLPQGFGHATLLFYTFGEQSRYITSTLITLQDTDKQNNFIFAFFEPYFSRLPHYSPSDSNCRPMSFSHTDWLHDDLAGNGSYSNFQVGLESGDKDIECMREGAPSRGLWLAGEHTAPFVASGTSTGAYWSGEFVAKRIAEHHGRNTIKLSKV